MSNAPERIWAFYAPEIEKDNPQCTIVAGDRPMHGARPYIRVDLAKPKVKPLVWLEKRRMLEAGPYQVCCNGSPSDPDAMYRVRFYGKVVCKQIKGVERAVAWANSHHERRILEALE